jgi:alpha-glucosidase (family GH31 glycosyl hydrolase)
VEALHNVSNEAILADTFLIAPVMVSGANTIDVVLPPVRWRRWTEDKVPWASGTLQVPVTMDDTPVYLREGRIAPIYDKPGATAYATVAGDVTLYIAPDTVGVALGYLYLDDGESFNLQRGDFLKLKFLWVRKTLTSSRVDQEMLIPALAVAFARGSCCGL